MAPNPVQLRKSDLRVFQGVGGLRYIASSDQRYLPRNIVANVFTKIIIDAIFACAIPLSISKRFTAFAKGQSVKYMPFYLFRRIYSTVCFLIVLWLAYFHRERY